MILKNILEAKLWLCFFFLVVFSGTALAQGPLILEGEVSNIDEGPFSMASILNNKESNYYFPIKNLGETSDTLKIEPIIPLSIAVIQERGFMQNPLGSSVYPVSEIGAAELESTNNFSVQDALNQIPGVKMDSRGYNGSRRLSLRGTIARSPFGVRNVRMKVNGFPITSSDGSSALELIEPADIQSMTIYKGPSGSYEMTGTGGVISTKLKSVYKPLAASAELTFGAA